MATVTVKVFATIREKFGHDSVQISGSTFIEAIRKLVSEYPELKDEVLREDMNHLKGDYIYLLNGRNVEYLHKEETLIKDGDKISIFPPIGGG
jgi:molybdopterin synthase sulfur carrier subunit